MTLSKHQLLPAASIIGSDSHPVIHSRRLDCNKMGSDSSRNMTVSVVYSDSRQSQKGTSEVKREHCKHAVQNSARNE